jgi:uncharacterized protein
MRQISGLCVIAVFSASCALAQQAPSTVPSQPGSPVTIMHEQEVIQVTGESTVTLRPDRVVFTIGVETFDPSVTVAVRENNRRTAAVVDALRRAGAEQDEIQTSNYSIYPRQEYREGRQPRIVGYQVNNTVRVRKSDPAAAGQLLEAAINAGANTASGLSLVVSDPTAGQREGLQGAFASARAKAEILAGAAGRSVGPALSISEGVMQAPPTPRVMAAARMEMQQDASVGQVPVEPGTEERRFVITVVFALR